MHVLCSQAPKETHLSEHWAKLRLFSRNVYAFFDWMIWTLNCRIGRGGFTTSAISKVFFALESKCAVKFPNDENRAWINGKWCARSALTSRKKAPNNMYSSAKIANACRAPTYTYQPSFSIGVSRAGKKRRNKLTKTVSEQLCLVLSYHTDTISWKCLWKALKNAGAFYYVKLKKFESQLKWDRAWLILLLSDWMWFILNNWVHELTSYKLSPWKVW